MNMVPIINRITGDRSTPLDRKVLGHEYVDVLAGIHGVKRSASWSPTETGTAIGGSDVGYSVGCDRSVIDHLGGDVAEFAVLAL